MRWQRNLVVAVAACLIVWACASLLTRRDDKTSPAPQPETETLNRAQQSQDALASLPNPELLLDKKLASTSEQLPKLLDAVRAMELSLPELRSLLLALGKAERFDELHELYQALADQRVDALDIMPSYQARSAILDAYAQCKDTKQAVALLHRAVSVHEDSREDHLLTGDVFTWISKMVHTRVGADQFARDQFFASDKPAIKIAMLPAIMTPEARNDLRGYDEFVATYQAAEDSSLRDMCIVNVQNFGPENAFKFLDYIAVRDDLPEQSLPLRLDALAAIARVSPKHSTEAVDRILAAALASDVTYAEFSHSLELLEALDPAAVFIVADSGTVTDEQHLNALARARARVEAMTAPTVDGG